MKTAETKDRIKEALEIREMKQSELVEKTGIDKGQMSSYLSGRYKPKQKNLHLLADTLSVDEAWLMGYDVPMERNDYEDPEILKRDAIFEDIENILKTEGYTLFCESYDDDYFLIKDSHDQTVVGFYNYELLARYNSLKKKGKITIKLLLSSETTFFKYLESLGYYIGKDDLDNKTYIHYGNGAVRIQPETLDNLRARIDTYAKAAVDSELLALQENELKQERLEKERLVKHLQGENIYSRSQFENDRKAYLDVNAAHQRTDLSKNELSDKARNKHDDDIMDDPNF